MNLLALDTSEKSCSVGVLYKNKIFSEQKHIARRHTQNIWPMISALLEQAQMDLSAIDAIVCGSGPGSFTGLRVAGSVAQGIAVALSKPIIPVNSLLSLSYAINDGLVWALMDAKRSQVYSAVYQLTDSIEVIKAPELISIDLASSYEFTNYHAVGSGWCVMAPKKSKSTSYEPVNPDVLLNLGLLMHNYAQDVSDFRLSYLRNKVVD